MFVTAILAAAGQSSRMNAGKLLLAYKGLTVFERALSPFIMAPLVNEVVVVVSPDSRLVAPHRKCRTVINESCREGMGTSIRAGVCASSQSTDVFLVALADMPELSAALIESLIGSLSAADKSILVPYCDGHHGHPVLFSGVHRPELAALSGDVGARGVVERHASRVLRFETDDRAVLFDVDTPDDVRLRRIAFVSDAARTQAADTLAMRGVWCETVDDALPGGLVGLKYHDYDDPVVRLLIPEGVAAD